MIRTLVVPRGNGSGARLAINYLSWAFFASLRAFVVPFQKRFDAIIVHETSPITQGYPALIGKKNTENSNLFLGIGPMAGKFAVGGECQE